MQFDGDFCLFATLLSLVRFSLLGFFFATYLFESTCLTWKGPRQVGTFRTSTVVFFGSDGNEFHGLMGSNKYLFSMDLRGRTGNDALDGVEACFPASLPNQWECSAGNECCRTIKESLNLVGSLRRAVQQAELSVQRGTFGSSRTARSLFFKC